jgi:hypothetical protein
MLNWFYGHLKDKLSLRTEEYRMQHGVEILGKTFTFVIDGSEQPVSSASDPVTNYEFYSAKKKQHSVNILMAVTPDGLILYLSTSFGSGTVDITMTTLTKSDWYAKLGASEWGLCDAGFNGLCGEWRMLPPPKRGNPFYRVHSRARIIVEQKFADIKDWRAAREPIRMSMADKESLLTTHHKIWTVIAVLVNDYRN